ncbi:MAG: HEAT repeat domain-containing protein [bacterium]
MKRISGRLCLLTFALAGLVCSAGAKVNPYSLEDWFEQDPKPARISVESIGNPLDYAGARIGLDVRSVELPRGWEGGYRFTCRLPVIDAVMMLPLYLKQWAEKAAHDVASRQRGLSMLAGGEGVSLLLQTQLGASCGGWGNCLADTGRLESVEAELVQRGYTAGFSAAVARLCGVMARAQEEMLAARVGLSAADAQVLAANPGYFLAPDGRKMPELTGDRTEQDWFIAQARRVDLSRIFDAAGEAGTGAWGFARTARRWTAVDVFTDTAQAHDVLTLDSPFGPVVIAGFGNDRHGHDAALLIDLGGNDTYNNNAGGAVFDRPVSVCIDLGGNDRYDAGGRSYVQGFGFFGVGILADVEGNDHYAAKHFAQGAGILGVGALWDGGGNDTFSAHAFCQGAGMFGSGVLLDDSGNDVYDCATMGQGSATTLGAGVLSDLSGDDKYRLACDTTKDALGGIPGYGQGGALSFRAYPWEKKLTAYGGVGLLVDDAGDDSYESKGWCSQGGSYIMSLGALVDNAGDDHYVCGTGQGSGIHITSAILVDRKGNDTYEGGFRSGGSGGDRSTGMLIDYEGDDVYRSSTSSYGTGCKPFSYSLFIDYKGNDRYSCDRPKGAVLFNDWHSFGGVWPESDPHLWPYAISLDLGGADRYAVRNRANNRETHSFGHGIHLDMEWTGGDVVGKVDPYRGLDKVLVRRGVVEQPDWFAEWFEYDNDPFERFRGVGLVTDSGTAMLHDVVSRARAGRSRDVLECIHHWFITGKLGDAELPELLKLLKAPDAETRLIIADDFGLWGVRGAESALVYTAATDTSAQVRRFALRALARLESQAGLAAARRLATEDESEDVRRVAVGYAGSVRDSADVFPLLRWALAEDKTSSVKCAAAAALGELGDERAVEPLREAARTIDVYLQRACGKSLCLLGQKDGLALLVASLQFPSIDAFENYDRNVPNTIAAFAGFDLPEAERYVQANWERALARRGDSIDIRANAAAYRAYLKQGSALRDRPDSVQVRLYEEFLAAHPTHSRARREFAGKLNGLAWTMVTAPAGSPARDVELGLRYARRAIELSADANTWDTLIEALIQADRLAEAKVESEKALVAFPGNAMLAGRLEQVLRLTAQGSEPR